MRDGREGVGGGKVYFPLASVGSRAGGDNRNSICLSSDSVTSDNIKQLNI